MVLQSEDIEALECHFKWKPEEGDREGDAQTTLEHLLENIDEYPDIKMLSLTVIGYLYAKWDSDHYINALEKFDGIIAQCLDASESQRDEYKGYEVVAVHNKINILTLLDRQEEAEELYRVRPDVKELPEKALASMYGCHGYALSLFGPTKYKKGISMYQKAKQLDPEQYCWYVGEAFVRGRLRRVEKGTRSKPAEEEESLLREALKLTNETKSIAIVLLADLLFVQGRDLKKQGITGNPKKMKEAGELYDKAYALNPHAPHVLKRCGKAFQIFGDEEKGLTCLLEAVKLDPLSSMNLHRLSQAYELGRTIKDYEKAEKYYLQAVTAGRRRNFYAELDLARLRKKRNRNYDLRKHYEDMKVHYLSDKERIKQLDQEIKQVEEYQRAKEERGRSGAWSKK